MGKNNEQSNYMITNTDLPLSCPMPDQILWNQHPRVYIALDDNGLGKCPYCGNQYQLSESNK